MQVVLCFNLLTQNDDLTGSYVRLSPMRLIALAAALPAYYADVCEITSP